MRWKHIRRGDTFEVTIDGKPDKLICMNDRGSTYHDEAHSRSWDLNSNLLSMIGKTFTTLGVQFHIVRHIR